jgi:MoxR-like ATPase
MCGREEAVLSDLWVLKYIWDNEEQIEILEGIINQTIEKDDSDGQHPQALYNKVPNPEEVMKEMQHLTERWQDESLSFEEQNVIKDKLRYLQSRCDWINNKEQKQYIQKEIEALWQKILQTV